MKLRSGLDEIVQVSHRADVIVLKSLDGEVACDGEDDDGVEVVG